MYGENTNKNQMYTQGRPGGGGGGKKGLKWDNFVDFATIRSVYNFPIETT